MFNHLDIERVKYMTGAEKKCGSGKNKGPNTIQLWRWMEIQLCTRIRGNFWIEQESLLLWNNHLISMIMADVIIY